MINITKKEMIEKYSDELFNIAEIELTNCLSKINGETPLTEQELRFIVEKGLPLKYLDVSEITDMSGLFKYMTINEDISNWNVSNVENMSFTFYFSTVNVDLSKWKTDSLTSLSYGFSGAKRDFGFSQWNTENLIDLSGTFYYATIPDLELSKWNVSNVEDLDYTFEKYGIIAIFDSENKKIIEEIENKEDSFKVNISNWNVFSVDSCISFLLKSKAEVDLSRWNTMSFRIIDNMFYSYKFLNFEIKDLNFANVKSARFTFFNSNISEDLRTLDFRRVVNIDYLFASTDYEYDVERMLINNDFEISTVAVVSNNHKYTHLTSNRPYFYIGNSSFNDDDIKDISYFDKIKTGLPISVNINSENNITQFFEDPNITYSVFKINESTKKKLNDKNIKKENNNFYELKNNLSHFNSSDLDSTFVFLSGRANKYILKDNEGYIDFDKITTLYYLKDNILYSIDSFSEPLERVVHKRCSRFDSGFVDDLNLEYNNEFANFYFEDESLFDISFSRELSEVKNNIKKTFIQKMTIFLNKIIFT